MVIKKALKKFYLSAEVLEKIRASGIYPDSKTFVDMPLRVDYTESIKKKILQSRDPKQLLKIVNRYFDEPGVNELLKVDLETESSVPPKIVSHIKDPEYKAWAMHLCKVWSKLVRRVNPELANRQDSHSLIFLDKPFVVPGGRFREVYYWDTYWSILGLLHSEMTDIVKSTLENLLSLVERYGFVPNGGRKYYENRSQPPFLALMVKAYYDSTKDVDFVKDCLPILEKEHSFWKANRSVMVEQNGKTTMMCRYSARTSQPRPESFKEDLITMENAGLQDDEEGQTEIYSNIASAAESGWDFSSRWFQDPYKMETIKTKDVIPVDLNSILCGVEFTLSYLHKAVANHHSTNDCKAHVTKQQYFEELATRNLSELDQLFWNEDVGFWCDFDLTENKVSSEYYASSFFPLWIFSTFNSTTATEHSTRAFQTIKDLGVLGFSGGLPTSLIESGEQWDFPNAWPPLQHVAVEALDPSTSRMNSNIKDQTDESLSAPSEMHQAGLDLAKRFLENAFISWKKTGHMYEKYSVTENGKAGHGGEYDVQEGFGWTNGVILDFLAKYGHELTAPSVQ